MPTVPAARPGRPPADRALADRTLADRTLADRTLADRTLADRTLADHPLAHRPVARLGWSRPHRWRGHGREEGMTTAEYAVGTLAACGFAGVLFRVVTGPEVLHALTEIVVKALRSSF